jgi:hypothetical protein
LRVRLSELDPHLALLAPRQPDVHPDQDRSVGHWNKNPTMIRMNPTYCGWRRRA